MATGGTIILYSDEQEEFQSSPDVHTPHIASVFVDEGLYADAQELEEALQHAVQVCLYLHFSVAQHFKPIHIHADTGHVKEDWALSDLAYYLMLLNGKPLSEQTAFAQAWIISRALRS